MIASPKTLGRWRRGKRLRLKAGGSLRDVSPTILKLLSMHVPPEMTGRPLF
jgi:bisphosphoglycerate-independent phosphoglycerate mutase (AlkP superfamily)